MAINFVTQMMTRDLFAVANLLTQFHYYTSYTMLVYK